MNYTVVFHKSDDSKSVCGHIGYMLYLTYWHENKLKKNPTIQNDGKSSKISSATDSNKT